MAAIGTIPTVLWSEMSALNAPTPMELSIWVPVHIMFLRLAETILNHKVPLGHVQITGGTMPLRLVHQARIVLRIDSRNDSRD